jgi:uncharacterized protein
LVFGPNDDTTAGLVMHEVSRALARFEPRVDVLELDAQPDDEDPGRLDVTLVYRVRATMAEHDLVVGIRLDGRG